MNSNSRKTEVARRHLLRSPSLKKWWQEVHPSSPMDVHTNNSLREQDQQEGGAKHLPTSRAAEPLPQQLCLPPTPPITHGKKERGRKRRRREGWAAGAKMLGRYQDELVTSGEPPTLKRWPRAKIRDKWISAHDQHIRGGKDLR